MNYTSDFGRSLFFFVMSDCSFTKSFATTQWCLRHNGVYGTMVSTAQWCLRRYGGTDASRQWTPRLCIRTVAAGFSLRWQCMRARTMACVPPERVK